MRRKLMLTLAATALSVLAAAGAAQAASPTITVLSPTGVTTGSATVRASIAPGGATTFYRVEYGFTSQYTAGSPLAKLSSTTKTRTPSVTLSGLQPGTIYHYRFDALNKYGGGLSNDHTFKTAGNPPADATTGGAVVLSDSSATVNAIINPHGQTTYYYFQFGPAAPGSTTFNTQVQALLPTAVPQVVSATLSGLTPGTFFQFRVVAFHSGSGGNATTYGAFSTFLTFPDAPHKQAPRVSARTTPHRILHRPFTLATTGHLVAPAGIPDADGCPQTARLAVWDGHHRVADEIVAVAPDCTFSASTTIGRLPHVPHKRGAKHRPVVVTVYLQFSGNGYVLPTRARPVRVQLGR